MNKLFKSVALPLVLAAIASAPQAFAQTVPSSANVTAIYNALANSETPQRTIRALVASGANPDTVASVAAVVGIPIETSSAVLPPLPTPAGTNVSEIYRQVISRVNAILGVIGVPVSLS